MTGWKCDSASGLGLSYAKRSVLFVWVTGEEKGLLGSKFFATHPTVAAKSMVADRLGLRVQADPAPQRSVFMRALTIEVANDPIRPAWKQDSFFRRFAASAD
jgi:Zn-dependent M28 family amino/carboxypeptidase